MAVSKQDLQAITMMLGFDPRKVEQIVVTPTLITVSCTPRPDEDGVLVASTYLLEVER